MIILTVIDAIIGSKPPLNRSANPERFRRSPAIGQATAMAVARGSTSQLLAERCPGGLQTRVRVGVKGRGIAKACYATMIDLGDGESRLGAADIDRCKFHYRPAAASIAEAPRSAPSAP